MGRTRTYCWSGAFVFEQEDLIQSALGLESHNRTPTQSVSIEIPKGLQRGEILMEEIVVSMYGGNAPAIIVP